LLYTLDRCRKLDTGTKQIPSTEGLNTGLLRGDRRPYPRSSDTAFATAGINGSNGRAEQPGTVTAGWPGPSPGASAVGLGAERWTAVWPCSKSHPVLM